MSKATLASKSNLLQELLDIIGRDELPSMTPEEVDEILKTGLPIALKTHLDIMLGGESERVKAWVGKDWLDRAGYSPVQKTAVKTQIQLDPETLAALKQIANEDSAVREKSWEGDQLRPGADSRVIEAEVEEESLLLGESDLGVSGPDEPLPSGHVSVRSGSNDKEASGGVPEGTPEDNGVQPGETDLAPDPEA